MTPFGKRLREMRATRGVSQKEMAAAIGVSPAYLSALEHGRRGLPSWSMLQRIIGYFNVIWDEADELAELASRSHPRIVVDTSGLSPRATALANRLSDEISELDDDALEAIDALLDAFLKTSRRRRDRG